MSIKKYLFLDNNEVKVYPTPYTEDLCTGGTPFATGSNSGDVQNAFDNDPTTSWGYGQGSNYYVGYVNIGYDFGDSNKRHVRQIVIYSAGASNNVSSVIIQSSDDNVTWFSLKTQTIIPDIKNYIELPPSKPQRYWRVLCNSISGMTWTGLGYIWMVREIEMMETAPQNWMIVGNPPVSKTMFDTNGMNSLSHLNRTNSTITKIMKDEGTLGQGKIYSYDLNISKFPDIKNITFH
ncbi:discoidin domain-containing protein [Paenibacillus oleatilyticus]|uniref:discoidin domain-containing protein n=1 Tax=Paenibacillus oleatilyticus TaxID=2594886 RepID=UPI001C2008C3|nr:discoidin domain-containing protein [Paenibacillus oleatilyticus]MBU7316166.1 discoidin domain-containing protein [Paenibacillus oleatilyticus]